MIKTFALFALGAALLFGATPSFAGTFSNAAHPNAASMNAAFPNAASMNAAFPNAASMNAAVLNAASMNAAHPNAASMNAAFPNAAAMNADSPTGDATALQVRMDQVVNDVRVIGITLPPAR